MNNVKEIWLPVVNCDGYLISNLGRVYTEKRKRLKSIHLDRYGYPIVVLSINNKPVTKKVHRLVAEAFIPNTENKPHINHKDENKLNNNVNNLEWVTPLENNLYGTRRERVAQKERKPIKQYSLTGEFIRAYDSITDASKMTNITHSNLRRCLRGKQRTAGGYKWDYVREEFTK